MYYFSIAQYKRGTVPRLQSIIGIIIHEAYYHKHVIHTHSSIRKVPEYTMIISAQSLQTN